MSGIEVAGLVLGAFPLVIDGIERYSNGVHLIRKILRPDGPLKRFRREIEIQYNMYLNTTHVLLADHVVQENWGSLDKDRYKEIWQEEWAQKRLETVLGPNGVSAYVETTKLIHEDLKDLQQKLGLEEGAKDNRDENKKAFKRRVAEVMLAISLPEYKNTLEDIQRNNQSLAIISGQQSRQDIDSHSTGTTDKAATRYFNTMRFHAKNIYTTFRERFLETPSCTCNVPHTVHLQLEARNPGTALKTPGRTEQVRFKFALLLEKRAGNATPWKWKEIELEPVEFQAGKEMQEHRLRGGRSQLDSLPPNDKHKHIAARRVRISEPTGPLTQESSPYNEAHQLHDLCEKLSQVETTQSFIGDLICRGATTAYRVWPPGIYSVCEPTIISLDTLLCERKLPKKEDRLRIGVTLASSLMQLHTTDWFHETWNTNDILFPAVNSPRSKASTPILQRPLIRRVFDAQDTAPMASSNSSQMLCRYNPSLFSLGVVLVELWWGQKFDREVEVLQNLSKEEMEALYDDAGQKFGEVVERCLFGLDCRWTSFEEDSFKCLVYNKIVEPLTQYWEDHTGRSRLMLDS